MVFVFSLSVVFSISPYAYDVNGYTITNSYYFDIGDVQSNQFDTEIRNNTETDLIYVYMIISLPDQVNSGNTIDFDLTLNTSTAASIGYNLGLYNQNNSQINSINGTLVSNQIRVSDIELTDTLDYITVRYTINDPTWTADPLETYYYWRMQVTDVQLTRDNSNILNNILDWIQSIYRNIANLPSNISESISGLFETLTESVNKIATDLIEGLEDLFVPDQEYLETYYDKYDQLLEDKFGFMYQSFDLVVEHTERFISALTTSQAADDDNSGYIQFPSVTVPLAGTDFTFGGWNVKIVPEGFEFLIESLKVITDIVCTIALVNTLYKRIVITLKGR